MKESQYSDERGQTLSPDKFYSTWEDLRTQKSRLYLVNEERVPIDIVSNVPGRASNSYVLIRNPQEYLDSLQKKIHNLSLFADTLTSKLKQESQTEDLLSKGLAETCLKPCSKEDAEMMGD